MQCHRTSSREEMSTSSWNWQAEEILGWNRILKGQGQIRKTQGQSVKREWHKEAEVKLCREAKEQNSRGSRALPGYGSRWKHEGNHGDGEGCTA